MSRLALTLRRLSLRTRLGLPWREDAESAPWLARVSGAQNPSELLLRLAVWLEMAEHHRRQVRAALIYPRILLVAFVAHSLLMCLAVWPQMFRATEVANPQSSLVRAGSVFFQTPVPLLLVLALAWATYRGMLLWVSREGELQRLADQSQWCRSLALLLREGQPLGTALANSAASLEASSSRERVAQAQLEVDKGGKLSAALGPEWHRAVRAAVDWGEEQEDLVGCLERAAETVDVQLEWQAERRVQVLAPALLCATGLLVLFSLASFWSIYLWLCRNIVAF